MASRAIPPHQDISAPLTAITPLMISASAGSAVSRDRRAAADHRFFRMLFPRTMVLLELAIGVDDLGQLLGHGGQMLTRQGVIQLVVGHFGIDAVADAAEAGDAVLGLH